MSVVGVVGFLAALLLPGTWITFGLPLRGLSFWPRLLAGVMVGPLVVILEFYLLRFIGVPFQLTATLIAVLNFPALYLVARRTDAWPRPDRRTVGGWLLALALPLAFLAVRFHDPLVRAYYGHAWMHADIIYMLANGALRPEEPQLAGVLLSYPWAGHIYQGVLSFLLGSAPVSNYGWTNVFWLLAVFGLLSAMVGELGGDRFARIATVIWLAFAVNAVGYVLWQTLPTQFASDYPVWGDPRYAPWLRKFYLFEQILLGLGMFTALTYLLIRDWARRIPWDALIVMALLLSGVGIVYPILFPAAAAVVGAKLVALLMHGTAAPRLDRYKDILALAVLIGVGGLVTFSYVSFVTAERASGGMVLVSGLYGIKVKAASSVVALSLLLAGLVLSLRRMWSTRRGALTVLVLGALGSATLYAVFILPHVINEYKYIFTAAICLAPFPALALETPLRRLGRWRLPVFALVAIALAAPAAHKMYTWPGLPMKDPPALDMRDFELRLAEQERFAAVCDVIRRQTPVETMLVTEKSDFEFPTVTQRQMYVPLADEFIPGVGLRSDHLLKKVKGYDEELIEERRVTVRRLFGGDKTARTPALVSLLELDRPVAILVEEALHQDLSTWLTDEVGAETLYRGEGLVLWLIRPRSPGGSGSAEPTAAR